MTEFGLRFLLFLIALSLFSISMVLEPKGDGEHLRVKSPKVEITFPNRSAIIGISKSIEKAKAVFDILISSDGRYDSGGFIVVEDFERAVLEAKRIGEVEVHNVGGERILILKDFDIVVVSR